MTTPGTQLTLAAKGAKGDAGTGTPGAAGVGAQGLWQPADNALVAANLDPTAGASVVPAAGVVLLCKVKMATDSAITSVALNLRTPAGAGLANTFVGVYTISGSTATLLATSADVSTQMQSASEQKFALTAPTAVQSAGTPILVALLAGSATTMPTLLGVTTGRINAFTTGAGRRTMASGAGLTALPASINLATASDPGTTPFVGLA